MANAAYSRVEWAEVLEQFLASDNFAYAMLGHVLMWREYAMWEAGL